MPAAYAPGSSSETAKTSEAQYLVEDFAADVRADRLPQVSWIVAPYKYTEHPEATPAHGESLVSRLIAALVANPAVWAKTAFIINYDENDGFFDHVPGPVPAIDRAQGLSTVDMAGESYKGAPVGLGIRVPLLVVSPWTRGGWVNSEVFGSYLCHPLPRTALRRIGAEHHALAAERHRRSHLHVRFRRSRSLGATQPAFGRG